MAIVESVGVSQCDVDAVYPQILDLAADVYTPS
jgi:hypothetical protein